MKHMLEFKISKHLKSYNGIKILKWEFFSNLKSDNLWEKIITEKDLKINLEGLDLFNHDGVIWIVFISLYRKFKKLHTEISLPFDMRKVSYLKYIGLDEICEISNIDLSNGYKFRDLDEDKLKKKNEREFIHYTRDNCEYSIQRIKLVESIDCENIKHYAEDFIKNILIKRSEYFNPTGQEAFEYFNSFYSSLKEIIQNISDHGFFVNNQNNQKINDIDFYRLGEGMGFVACTPPRKKENYLRFCCSDVGPGLFFTLKNKITRFKLKDEKEAIIEACLYRYFNKDDKIIGLFPVLEYIRSRNGKIKIRYGKIYSILDFSKPLSREIFDNGYSNPTSKWMTSLWQFYQPFPKIPGTHIIIELNF